ncbi:phosphodiester glycosidase family protein, partial [Myxococcota bacterium]|nr:phosphodiester glycosidase family protein [Myxococcota bacterium]
MSIRRPSNSALPTARPIALAVMAAALPAPAGAVRLEARGETSPAAGVVVRQYRTSSPATNAWAAFVDLCAARISVEATEAPDGLQSTGGWGGDAGVVLATNGDFYRTGPVHVYGLAVGDGVAWPRLQTGVDPAYDGEWFFRDFGFIAFGHDWVDFSHTKWVKNNVPEAQAGWSPGEVVDTAPPGAISLVSGFPELVTEGRAMQCDDPTSDQCFRDRSDMRARHPRTAMGLTEDRRTFILLVVDGRTGSSAGMYGTELAATMAQLGAWQAFNLDGGGSSQLWVRGEGYLNDVDGNNSGSGTRSVANHWGVKVAGNPERPAHCVAQAPCGVVPAEGGVVDDDGACFHAFGPAQFWRHETGAAAGGAEGGGLHWTNAYSGSLPDNWAWWQLHLAEAGRYRVEARGSAAFGLFDRVTYEILADGAVTTVRIDQGAADAWIPLAELDFAAGGRQHVRVHDNAAGEVAAGRHIVADAIRLVRLDGAPVPEPGADAGGESGGDASNAAEAGMAGPGTDARSAANVDALHDRDARPGRGDGESGDGGPEGGPNGGGGAAGPALDAIAGPGQARFDFMWPIIADNALGAIILADNSRADSIARTLDYVREFAPRIVAG